MRFKIKQDALKEAIIELNKTITDRIREEGYNENTIFAIFSRAQRGKSLESNSIRKISKILKVNWRKLVE